jgi:hypothetical protein
MTPVRFNECLKQIDWSLETLAENLGCDESLAKAYSLGIEEVPLELESWLETLAQARAAPDPLQAMLGPSPGRTNAGAESQRELADVERRVSIARLERENAIMKQAIRRSQYYLGLVLQPDGLSAKDCITGLLRALDNDEINEVTKRRGQ